MPRKLPNRAVPGCGSAMTGGMAIGVRAGNIAGIREELLRIRCSDRGRLVRDDPAVMLSSTASCRMHAGIRALIIIMRVAPPCSSGTQQLAAMPINSRSSASVRAWVATPGLHFRGES